MEHLLGEKKSSNQRKSKSNFEYEQWEGLATELAKMGSV